MIDVPDKEIIPIIYTSQRGDIYTESSINIIPYKPFYGNGTTIYSLDYTLILQ